MRVAVTGAFGMLGFHVRALLHGMQEVDEVLPLGRGDLDDASLLASNLRGVDVVIHLAGVNRSDPHTVRQANPWLANQLAEALRKSDSSPHVVFSNSVHRARDDAYGLGKREAAEILKGLREDGVSVTDMVLPHVFGEFGRPNYNSVVHTFAVGLMRGHKPEVNRDGRLDLLHASRAADLIWDSAFHRVDDEVVAAGQPMSVGNLFDALNEMHRDYHGALLAAHDDPLRLDLLNTLRSYYFPDWMPGRLVTHGDDRGVFFEAIKVASGGQTSVSTTAPGITRGQHWHRRKVERFVVVRGQARIQLRRLFDAEVIDIDVFGDEPTAVDMPTMVVHNITNTGAEELVTLFWTNDLFDPANPDTYPEAV